MKKLIIIAIMLMPMIALGDEWKIYDCGAYSYRVRDYEVQCRDYTCENERFDKTMKEYRKIKKLAPKGPLDFDSAISDWEGFKKFKAGLPPSDCLEIWSECDKELEEAHYYERFIKEYGAENLCDMYDQRAYPPPPELEDMNQHFEYISIEIKFDPITQNPYQYEPPDTSAMGGWEYFSRGDYVNRVLFVLRCSIDGEDE